MNFLENVPLNKVGMAARNPNLVGREFNRYYHYLETGRAGYNIRGIDIVEESWDNMILLDACRFDMFEDLVADELPGTLEQRTSRGSATVEYLYGNFHGRSLDDTVYATANPQLHYNSDNLKAEFHAIENIWLSEGWDHDSGTVLPETVTRVAKETAERYPDKRLIVHYLQPHFPFLTRELGPGEGKFNEENRHIWINMITGRIDVRPDEVVEAYYENLELLVPHLEELLDSLVGRTVITSDHGNALGERARPIPVKLWGHPRRIYVPELVEVPWQVVEDGEREITMSGRSVQSRESVDESTLTERLEDLGYK